MLLAVDSGNTNVTVALYHDSDVPCAQWRLSNAHKRTADEYAVVLSELFRTQNFDFSMVHDCIISSVVPDVLYNLKSFVKKYLKKDPLILSELKSFFKNTNIDQPLEAGMDRIVNAFAVHNRYKQYESSYKIVVDFGTATSFDLVDMNGRYCGGLFVPGANLALKSLSDAAAQLPRVSIAKPPKVIGTNTIDCMQSGMFWGYLSLIEGLIDKMNSEHQRDHNHKNNLPVIATGGLNSLFKGHTTHINHFDDDLILYGLYHIYLIAKS